MKIKLNLRIEYDKIDEGTDARIRNRTVKYDKGETLDVDVTEKVEKIFKEFVSMIAEEGINLHMARTKLVDFIDTEKPELKKGEYYCDTCDHVFLGKKLYENHTCED